MRAAGSDLHREPPHTGIADTVDGPRGFVPGGVADTVKPHRGPLRGGIADTARWSVGGGAMGSVDRCLMQSLMLLSSSEAARGTAAAWLAAFDAALAAGATEEE